MDHESAVQQALPEVSPKLLSLSRYLCSHPELGRSEVKAHAALTSLLKDEGFSVTPHFPTETSFIGSHIEACTSQPHVALLCEYDALPEIGHACGHNLIAVVAVGAAIAVRTTMQRFGLKGKVSVFGTPAEETDGGKIDFINGGFFKDVDAALMVHPVGRMNNVANPRTTTCSCYTVAYHGKASHASANPWETTSALDAAVLAYQNVSHLRQHIPPRSRVVGVITNGGELSTIIPEVSEMEFTMRTATSRERENLVQRWKACMESAALATGCQVSFKLRDRPYDDLNGNEILAEVYRRHSINKGIETARSFDFAWSTDAGNVSYVVPTIHPVFKIDDHANIHERDFADLAAGEPAFHLAIQQAHIIALTALEVLTDESLRSKMKEEFDCIK